LKLRCRDERTRENNERLKGEHGLGREQQGNKSKPLAGKLERELGTKPAPSPTSPE